jgi:hypothetical protein
MPSLAFRTAWSIPLIWAVNRLEIAIPAASSFALLILRPDDNRPIDTFSALCVFDKFRCAFKDAIFVLIVIAMVVFLLE